MDYLERNRILLEELRNTAANPLVINPRLNGHSRAFEFFSCGSFESEHLGKKVYVGIKWGRLNQVKNIENSFHNTLYNSYIIAERHPELLPNLPAFSVKRMCSYS